MESLAIEDKFSLAAIGDFVFQGPRGRKIVLPDSWKNRVLKTHSDFLGRLDRHEPIYGVTTGFGDSNFRRIAPQQSEQLQQNLVRYLTCGSGPLLRRPVRRAICLFRLLSLARGYSGVSPQLIEQLIEFVEADFLPLIPTEGSLGASGDLIPLAYLAGVLQGWGEVETPTGVRPTDEVLKEAGKSPYRLKPKEGLALVNGTSAMAGQAFVNVTQARMLTELATLETAWLCLAIGGRTESFGLLVNEKAKQFSGQARTAAAIRKLLAEENYIGKTATPLEKDHDLEIQDRYSLRCAPQVLGPILETVELVENWIAVEVNGVSDNPLFDPDEELMATGGNFYGGYLSHGMDYLKICLSHAADLIDRQITLVVDEKSNRGLPANLANWPGLPAEERYLHHGLKGLHQSISAITSELIARSMPNGVFSRSSESHNQDKVSLGMSAAVACEAQLDALFRIHAMALICLAQAVDLRGITLKGATSLYWYEKIRSVVPFVERDRSLDKAIFTLSEILKEAANQTGNSLGKKL